LQVGNYNADHILIIVKRKMITILELQFGSVQLAQEIHSQWLVLFRLLREQFFLKKSFVANIFLLPTHGTLSL